MLQALLGQEPAHDNDEGSCPSNTTHDHGDEVSTTKQARYSVVAMVTCCCLLLQDESSDEEEGVSEGGVVDMEDMGKIMMKQSKKSDSKEMVTPLLRKNLTKQGVLLCVSLLAASPLTGYRIVGSHSGVKMCRWTKSMLRGRGGCYKHTFYGIESHRCMEATPSLACANKCVFCWRYDQHHSSSHYCPPLPQGTIPTR